jgi:Uma2 family endonuclease
MKKLLIRDPQWCEELIRERKRKGIDLYDEVWEGVYVIPSMPTLAQQRLVGDLGGIFNEVVKKARLGQTYPGANVSDRRKGWGHNYRIPDVLVVLNKSRAIDCETHFCGGPDFVVEIESPGNAAEGKVSFYQGVGVRELLIIHRDKRTLRLLRLEREELLLVQPSLLEGKEWLVSAVLPLALRRSVSKNVPRTQVRRTDGGLGLWTV